MLKQRSSSPPPWADAECPASCGRESPSRRRAPHRHRRGPGQGGDTVSRLLFSVLRSLFQLRLTAPFPRPPLKMQRCVGSRFPTIRLSFEITPAACGNGFRPLNSRLTGAPPCLLHVARGRSTVWAASSECAILPEPRPLCVSYGANQRRAHSHAMPYPPTCSLCACRRAP